MMADTIFLNQLKYNKTILFIRFWPSYLFIYLLIRLIAFLIKLSRKTPLGFILLSILNIIYPVCMSWYRKVASLKKIIYRI